MHQAGHRCVQPLKGVAFPVSANLKRTLETQSPGKLSSTQLANCKKKEPQQRHRKPGNVPKVALLGGGWTLLGAAPGLPPTWSERAQAPGGPWRCPLLALEVGGNAGLGRNSISGSRSSFINVHHSPCVKSRPRVPKGVCIGLALGVGIRGEGLPCEARMQGILGFCNPRGQLPPPPALGLSTMAWLSRSV